MSSVIDYFRDVVEDSYSTFNYARQWKEQLNVKLLGYYPVYFPEEIAYAMGLLPIRLFGGVGRVDPVNAMSKFQSFMCSIPKTILELIMTGRLDSFDVLAFSNICDVARNLAFVVRRNFKDKFHVIYLHYPINNASRTAVEYLRGLYVRLVEEFGKVTGARYDPKNLERYIALCNRKRAILSELVNIRSSKPWKITFDELYTVALASMVMPVGEFVEMAQKYLEHVKARGEERPVERIRVLVLGEFCEQPPLQLYRLVELSGAYILFSDYIKDSLWLGQVELSGEDPLTALARAYVTNPTPLTTRYHPTVNKHEYISRLVKELKADAVIFFTPKFCEPAVYDYIIYRGALEKLKVPYHRIDYEEGMTSFEQQRMSIETFIESLTFEL